jgi:hypothetical protein
MAVEGWLAAAAASGMAVATDTGVAVHTSMSFSTSASTSKYSSCLGAGQMQLSITVHHVHMGRMSACLHNDMCRIVAGHVQDGGKSRQEVTACLNLL